MKTETVLDTAKSVAYYMALPYTTVLRRDDEGDVVAHIEELPGCVAHGEDSHEALAILEEFKQAWIERCIAAGNPVPEPQIEEPLPSGKWLQRVPRTLHKKLARIAKREDVSLNQLVTSMLSEAVAVKTWEEAMKRCKVQFSEYELSNTDMRDRSWVTISQGDWILNHSEPQTRIIPYLFLAHDWAAQSFKESNTLSHADAKKLADQRK